MKEIANMDLDKQCYSDWVYNNRLHFGTWKRNNGNIIFTWDDDKLRQKLNQKYNLKIPVPCIYYLFEMYDPLNWKSVIKVGQSIQLSTRWRGYTTKLNSYHKKGKLGTKDNGNFKTSKTILELFEKNTNDFEIHAVVWFLDPLKKHTEIQNNIKIPLSPDLRKLEALEKLKFNNLLLE